jgi:hypothetical protein
MRRARHPLPLFLRDLTFNPNTGWYEITERGVTYRMKMEHTRLMKEYFNANSQGTLNDWYTNYLKREDKKTMERAGNIREIDNGFRPDVEYDD